MSYEEEKQDRKIDQLGAEIGRLRADNAGLSKAVIDIQEERDLVQAEFRTYHKAWKEQAARIQELKDDLETANASLRFDKEEIERLRARDKQMAEAIVSISDRTKRYVLSTHAITKSVFDEADSLVDYCEKLAQMIIAKDARIQELEDALVDARGKLFHQFGDVELDPPGEDDCRIVREMLQAEGKIGPDASKPRSWQITDERKAAVEHLIAVGCGYGGTCGAISILRTMLTEAGQ